MLNILTRIIPNKLKLALAILILAIVISGLLIFIGNSPKLNNSQSSIPRVTAIALQAQTITPEISLHGIISNPFITTVRATITAVVKSVPIRIGDLVTKDQPVIKI